MTKIKLLLSLLVLLTAFSCKNIGFKKTKSGTEYKIYSNGKGQTPVKHGVFLKVHNSVSYNDSSLFSSFGGPANYSSFDTSRGKDEIFELLGTMKEGDSLVFYQSYEVLNKLYPNGLPDFIKKGGKLKTAIKIEKVFTKGPEEVQADEKKELDAFKNRQLADIEKYLALKKINARKINNNVFVEIQSEGTGPAADSGKIVGIKYSGMNFEGKYFDSNVDTTKQFQKHDLQTLYFASKQGGVIPGMLEGITEFKVGSKGRIFIPSILAYGPQGSPPAIKPNENLIFEVEVVEVKDQPAQPAMPSMPQGQVQEPK